MGSWGPGNFQQDYALDFVWKEVQQPLIQKLEEMVADPVLAEPDEPSSGPIMASVELLAVLSEQVNAVPPQPEEVAKWRSTFLAAWEGPAEELYAHAKDIDARRSVIVETFDRLGALAEKWHNEGRLNKRDR